MKKVTTVLIFIILLLVCFALTNITERKDIVERVNVVKQNAFSIGKLQDSLDAFLQIDSTTENYIYGYNIFIMMKQEADDTTIYFLWSNGTSIPIERKDSEIVLLPYKNIGTYYSIDSRPVSLQLVGDMTNFHDIFNISVFDSTRIASVIDKYDDVCIFRPVKGVEYKFMMPDSLETLWTYNMHDGHRYKKRRR